MLNPWVLLAVVLAWGASIAMAGWKGYDAGKAACEADVAREERLSAQAAQAAASVAAAAISKLEVKHVTTRQILEREVLEKPVFRDCRSGLDSVRAFNATIPGAAASDAAGSGKLPSAHTAD